MSSQVTWGLVPYAGSKESGIPEQGYGGMGRYIGALV